MQQFSLKKSIFEKISNIVPLVTLFLVPIFFLPLSSEFYSFNKLALIIVSTIILLILWGLKTIKGDKLEIIKSPIDKSLTALLIVTILATIFSVSKTDSIFGAQGRWMGVAAFATMFLFFYLSAPAFKEVKTLKLAAYLVLISSTVSSLVSILSYYKIFLAQSPFVRFQNFSLTGSIKDAVLLAVISFVMSIVLAINQKETPIKILLFISTAINLYFIAVTGTLLGWILLVIGLGLILLFTKPETISRNRNLLLVQTLGIAAPILALVFIPGTRKILVDSEYIGELTLPVRESWAITTSAIRDYPMLATGPGTFHLNFSRFKPLSLNNTIYWSNTFDKPFNEFFNALSTIGIIGTTIGVIFALSMINFALKSRSSEDETGMMNLMAIVVVMVTASFALHHATILSVFFMFMSASMLIGSHLASENNNLRLVKPVSLEVTGLASVSSAEDQAVITGQYTKYILAIPAFLLAGYLGYSSYRVYAGEYFMRKSLNAISTGNIAEAYEHQISALRFNPNRDSYYDAFSKVNMTIAIAIASKDPEELTDKDRQDIQTLISQALQNSKLATEQVGPLNVANWRTRAQIYQNLVNVAQNAFEWSISAYNTAIQLDPVNPALRLDLGGVYFAAGDYLSAANQFRQAVTLKQDYANARYNFALSLVALGELAQAKQELEITKLLLPEGSEDRNIIDQEIQNLVSRMQPVEQEVEKPTVEELTGVPEELPQEPLTNVTEPQTEIGPEILPQQPQENTQQPVQEQPVQPVTPEVQE
jgi:hypothetical protein